MDEKKKQTKIGQKAQVDLPLSYSQSETMFDQVRHVQEAESALRGRSALQNSFTLRSMHSKTSLA